MSSLSTQIADFGARANRITIQSQIYASLELANKENLSEKQDTDLTEAILNLKAKEVAYQAALSARRQDHAAQGSGMFIKNNLS
jgi:flagellar hook-associated protein 3 FlgL